MALTVKWAEPTLMSELETEDKQQVFLKLYEPVHARLSRYCQVQVADYDEARDLMGETVLVAYEKFEGLRNHDTFLYFLFGIALNLVRKKRRKEHLFKFFRQTNDFSALIIQQEGPEAVDHILLNKALDHLSAEQREAIVLFEISGFSLEEISKIQDSGLSAVKQRLFRGREKLRKLLGDKESSVINAGKTQKILI